MNPITAESITMSDLQIISVSLGNRSYDIEAGSENLEHIGSFLTAFKPISAAVILTDENIVQQGYAHRVAESIAETGIDVHLLSIASGEQSKSIETTATLWETLLEEGIDRKSVLISVGGGVIGDLGGFVAATYARGIRFFQVPTTLLAQVDSSVGGKVGINLPNAKNMVGAFLQPLGVLIDTKILQTLPETQYQSGLGEVVKYGASLDAGLFQLLETNTEKINIRDPNILKQIVTDCCRIKANIVAEDEFETTGRRVLLNYGHTFAHAFEIQSNFTLLHGLAVSIGSICAAKLAVRMGFVNEIFLKRQIGLQQALGLPTEIPEGIDWLQTIELMRHDKKSEFGKLCFVLPTGIGSCRLVDNIDSQLLEHGL
ncbi:MAG: 3-dehydroquinate synthase [Planctomycetaceae bacterium]|jgi:3-dehydroquinate synthase|nr:3-dehydroquinate synthase [Planctomycetaceae bacterium]